VLLSLAYCNIAHVLELSLFCIILLSPYNVPKVHLNI
jgi:hypothetical protein